MPPSAWVARRGPFLERNSPNRLPRLASSALASSALRSSGWPQASLWGHGGGVRSAALALPGRSLAPLAALALLSMLTEGAVGDWSGTFLMQSGVAIGFVAAAYAAFSLCMITGRIFGDAIVALAGPRATVAIGSVIAAAGLVIAVARPGLPAGVAGFALVGVGLANVVPSFSAPRAEPVRRLQSASPRPRPPVMPGFFWDLSRSVGWLQSRPADGDCDARAGRPPGVGLGLFPGRRTTRPEVIGARVGFGGGLDLSPAGRTGRSLRTRTAVVDLKRALRTATANVGSGQVNGVSLAMLLGAVAALSRPWQSAASGAVSPRGFCVHKWYPSKFRWPAWAPQSVR